VAQPTDQPAPAGPRRLGRPRHETPSPDYLARKDLILQTAAQIFAAKGYDAGTLDDVAEALDMRKASLYHYVRSKRDLVSLLFVRAFEAGVARLEQAGAIADPRARLIAIIRVFVDEMADHPGLVATFSGVRPRFNDERDAQFEANDRRMIKIVTCAVEDAVRAGVLPAVDARYGALAIIGMVSSVHKWYDPRLDPDPELIAANFARLLGLE
jgi:TetR/AcrR family transcriptional regulator, cholesterol catabolism regulator